jgi:hypothetical protein
MSFFLRKGPFETKKPRFARLRESRFTIVKRVLGVFF